MLTVECPLELSQAGQDGKPVCHGIWVTHIRDGHKPSLKELAADCGLLTALSAAGRKVLHRRASRQSILIPSFSNDKFYLLGAQKIVALLLILPKVLLTGMVKLKALVTFVYFSVIFFLFFFFSSKYKSNI